MSESVSSRAARQQSSGLRQSVDIPAGRLRSPLTRRIILFNALALVFLITGVLTVESHRLGLVDERLASIRQQGKIIASTLAEYTASEERNTINLEEAEPLLRQLVAPTQLRARLYGTDGKLAIDTRDLQARNIVEVSPLPALDFWSRADQMWHRIYDGVMGVRPFARLAPYFEAGRDGRVYSEVNAALRGETVTAQRVDDQNRLVLSVAVPVQRFKAISGVLLVSTEGGDIDAILRAERATLIEVFLVALLVMLISSLYLAGAIAEPIRRLAVAAERVQRGRMGQETMPAMPERNDEIGDLAASLSDMTKALYHRIDAIESFAADVAHELKNPLTSLKSAIEMLDRSEAGRRDQLLAIIQNDVRRIDRLISDISDASRLDAELSREMSEPVDLRHLLTTLVDIYRMLDMQRGITLDLRLPPVAVPLTVLGRDERLGQVFRNLIDNAISFSPEHGIVTITANAGHVCARISIEDQGPGIPPQNHETIFARFYTERPGEHGFGNNSGLGLSIARQILTGLSGRVWAETRAEGGARFTVELPLAKRV